MRVAPRLGNKPVAGTCGSALSCGRGWLGLLATVQPAPLSPKYLQTPKQRGEVKVKSVNYSLCRPQDELLRNRCPSSCLDVWQRGVDTEGSHPTDLTASKVLKSSLVAPRRTSCCGTGARPAAWTCGSGASTRRSSTRATAAPLCGPACPAAAPTTPSWCTSAAWGQVPPCTEGPVSFVCCNRHLSGETPVVRDAHQLMLSAAHWLITVHLAGAACWWWSPAFRRLALRL
jgi:hypothetical protein